MIRQFGGSGGWTRATLLRVAISICVLASCVEPGATAKPRQVVGSSGGDCRNAAEACADGFPCTEDPSGVWACIPAEPGGSDATRPGAPSGPDNDASVPAEGPAPDEPDAAPKPVVNPNRGDVGPGGRCARDVDCAAGTCEQSFNRGACVQECTADNDCPAGSRCTSMASVQICLPLCGSEGDCRNDWVCNDPGLCTPGCADYGCEGRAVCQATSGLCQDTCEPLPEECNSFDDDCDGRADNGATCANGGDCVGGACTAPPPPAGPCSIDADCEATESCYPDDGTLPGGMCIRACRADADCGATARCENIGNAQSICFPTCASDRDCRQGWQCGDPVGICTPHCDYWGCPEGYACNSDTGACYEPLYRVSLEQVAIAPGKPNGTTWDQDGRVAADAYDAVAGAVLDPLDPWSAVLSALAEWALNGFVPPDIRGTMELHSHGEVVCEYTLPDGANEDSYAPGWRRAVCQGVSLLPEAATSLRVVLVDDDVRNHDAVGTIIIDSAHLAEAAAAGIVYPIPTIDQGARSVVMVMLSVLPE